MICSPLTTSIVDFGTKNSNPRNQKIIRLTPHHMAGMTNNPAGVAKAHMNAGVSANYYISGKHIVAGVSEDRRAWTSNSPSNDQTAITFEVANSTLGPNWKISDESYNTLVKLCADICNRYGIIPHYDGTKNGTITMHKQFAATACPGPYLENLIVSHKFENDIMAAMTGQHPVNKDSSFPNTPFTVRVKVGDLNIREGAGTYTKRLGYIKKGVYTIVEVRNNEWGRLKSGAGWIFIANRDWVEVR